MAEPKKNFADLPVTFHELAKLMEAFPPLPEDEMLALARKAAAGDQVAAEKAFKHCAGIVLRVYHHDRKATPSGINSPQGGAGIFAKHILLEDDELLSAAIGGLWYGIQHYDSTYGKSPYRWYLRCVHQAVHWARAGSNAGTRQQQLMSFSAMRHALRAEEGDPMEGEAARHRLETVLRRAAQAGDIPEEWGEEFLEVLERGLPTSEDWEERLPTLTVALRKHCSESELQALGEALMPPSTGELGRCHIEEQD